MQITRALVLGCFLFAVSPKGLAKENPLDIVKKALNAQGGMERLTNSGSVYRKIRGAYIQEKEEFTGESFSEVGGKIRLEHTSLENNIPSTRVLVLNGEKGWLSYDGIVISLEDELKTSMKRARYSDRVAGLVDLIEKKDYQLTYLGEDKVKNKKVRVIKVEKKDFPAMKLYFDKESGFLVKTYQKFKDAFTLQEAVHELYFLDYKKLDPAMPEKKLLTGKKISLNGSDLVGWLRKRIPSGQDKKRLEKLVEQLHSSRFRVREWATLELKKAGPEAGPLLRKALKSSDPEVVRRAEQSLESIRNNPSSFMIPSVVRLLALKRPPDATKVLLEYLPWAKDETIAKEIMDALFEINRKEKTPPRELVKALESKQESIRMAALAALEKDGGKFSKKPGRRVYPQGITISFRCELYRNGEKSMELETREIQLFSTLDSRLFDRPEPENE